MEFIRTLSLQPLFRLLGAIIVLAVTDSAPMAGVVAGIVWVAWILLGRPPSRSAFFPGTE